MKIAVVSPYSLDAPGGVQDQVVSLVRWLGDAGHDAFAVGPGRSGPEGAVLVGGAISIPTNRSRAPIALSPFAVRRVRRAVRSADLVHVHEPFMPMVGLAAAIRPRVPTVGTFHADVGGLASRAYRWGRPLLRRVVGSLGGVTAVSSVAAAAVAGVANPVIVPNGIDLDRFRTGPAEPHRVVFLGRDEPRKGLDVLLRAWPHVRSLVPDAELHVLGALRETWLEGVVFHGRVGEEQKVDLLAQASVYCGPHLGGESFGIVIAEAMAAGCVPVVSDLPAFRAVAGDVGQKVRPGDAEALGEALVTVLLDHDGRETQVAAGLEQAGRFSSSAVLEGYLAVYEAALESL